MHPTSSSAPAVATDAPATDSDLIARVRAGDTAAFRHLVERYEGRVASTVTSMLGHTAEAEDVGQETFIRFYRALPSFRGDSSVATYLTRIAINQSLNALKRRKRFLSRFRPADDDASLSPEPPDVDARERRRLVRQALDALPPSFRAVVVLRMIEGYSTKETAELLNLPLGTVLSRLSRAQDKMRDWLMPYMNDEDE